MQSPELASEALRHAAQHNGDRPSPSPDRDRGRGRGWGGQYGVGRAHAYYSSSASLYKLRRFNTLILVVRIVSLCFSLAASIFMALNIHKFGNDTSSNKARWYDYGAFRYVFAANAINCIYSSAQIALVMWELLKGNTLLPEMIQVWFDFGHDQVFAYLLLSASSAGTALAQNLRSGHIWVVLDHSCKDVNAFCIQSDIAISLGFGAFLFLASVCLLSGFRVACFIITNSRFHL